MRFRLFLGRAGTASKATGRGAHAAGEKAAEICWILETQIVRDLRDGHSGVAQLAFRFDEHACMHELSRGLAGDSVDDASPLESPHAANAASTTQSAARQRVLVGILVAVDR